MGLVLLAPQLLPLIVVCFGSGLSSGLRVKAGEGFAVPQYDRQATDKGRGGHNHAGDEGFEFSGGFGWLRGGLLLGLWRGHGFGGGEIQIIERNKILNCV